MQHLELIKKERVNQLRVQTQMFFQKKLKSIGAKQFTQPEVGDLAYYNPKTKHNILIWGVVTKVIGSDVEMRCQDKKVRTFPIRAINPLSCVKHADEISKSKIGATKPQSE